MPSGDLGIVIAFREHLPLLGEPEAAVERFRGEREDAACRWPTATAERAAAAVEEGDLHAPRRCRFVEPLLRCLEAPTGGQVAAVLRAVGISDHDDLPVAAAGQMGGIVRLIEDLGEGVVAVGEVVDLLEQRHDGDVGRGDLFAPRPRPPLGPAPQPEDGEDVGRGPGEADDRPPQALRAKLDDGPVEQFEQREGVEREGIEARSGDLIRSAERGHEHRQPAFGIGRFVGPRGAEAGGGENLPHDPLVGPGVLTDVELCHVEAEGADEIDPAAREGVVGEEPVGVESGEEIFGVGDERGVRGVGPRYRAAVETQLPRGLESEADHADPAPECLVGGEGAEGFAERLVGGCQRIELRRERAGAGGQLIRHREEIVEPGALFKVAVDRLFAEPMERLAGDVGGHVGVAVAVSPHPRPEGEERRHIGELPWIPLGEAAAE